ncbi:MAG: hypothetical protein MR598_01310 [Erysipelotrichaceae bacterium]|nr:hypothetical protein [Erysipelotrichaceae bacterium]
MSIHTLFIYIMASFLLSIILEKVETQKQDHFLDYIVVTILYIVVLAGIFSTYHITENNHTIFLIVLFQIIGSMIYQNVILEVSSLKNNDAQVKKYAINLMVAYLVNTFFISRVNSVFLNMEEVKLLLWLFLMLYFYYWFKNNITIPIPKNKKILFYQDREYIVMQYAKFKNRYGSLVYSRYRELVPTIFAIMIYENYYRPEMVRKIDHFKYRMFKRRGRFGIMQISSNHELTDEESIKMAIRRLENIYSKVSRDKRNSWNRISKVIFQYHRKDAREILNIDREIRNFIKK